MEFRRLQVFFSRYDVRLGVFWGLGLAWWVGVDFPPQSQVRRPRGPKGLNPGRKGRQSGFQLRVRVRVRVRSVSQNPNPDGQSRGGCGGLFSGRFHPSSYHFHMKMAVLGLGLELVCVCGVFRNLFLHIRVGVRVLVG